MLNLYAAQQIVDGVLTHENRLFSTFIPGAGHLSDSAQPLNLQYYIRHRIETIHRIRETSITDAIALAHMLKEDYDSARHWANYTTEELNHDKLFLADLAHHNISMENVLLTPKMTSTNALIQFLHTSINNQGSLPAVAYSIAVEWNSERASMAVAERVQKTFDKSHVKGALAHAKIDENEDHYQMVLEIAVNVMKKRNYETSVLINNLKHICHLLRCYFYELHFLTAAKTSGFLSN